jgi:uncharacterized tellurite resistance protein B-like protein
MLKTLSALVDALSGRASPQPAADERQLLAASLIVDCALVDGTLAAPERAMLRKLVTTYTGLAGSQADDFLRKAEAMAAEQGDFAAVASELRRSLDPAQRRTVVELMWQVALADGHLHEFEEDLIDRAADLLGIEPGELAVIKAMATADKPSS